MVEPKSPVLACGPGASPGQAAVALQGHSIWDQASRKPPVALAV